ncbi:hypothetical protein GOB85_12520 [Acetobacter sp. LMG 1636]|uniref:DUF6874 domain-containing protein n=1 Tax=Acetobacter fallax TaxID=1737473 RepID=A0ABX0KA57_9PROT|nr:hypothetical protein [Acetobacter fallax]NHO36928.1 hypothetical protein [Acetobacter fallax]
MAERIIDLKPACLLSQDVDDIDLEIEMDLIATHSNGCPLDLERLYEADDFNLLHDVIGIRRHLDRSTGKLTDHFLPRFSQRPSWRS